LATELLSLDHFLLFVNRDLGALAFSINFFSRCIISLSYFIAFESARQRVLVRSRGFSGATSPPPLSPRLPSLALLFRALDYYILLFSWNIILRWELRFSWRLSRLVLDSQRDLPAEPFPLPRPGVLAESPVVPIFVSFYAVICLFSSRISSQSIPSRCRFICPLSIIIALSLSSLLGPSIVVVLLSCRVFRRCRRLIARRSTISQLFFPKFASSRRSPHSAISRCHLCLVIMSRLLVAVVVIFALVAIATALPQSHKGGFGKFFRVGLVKSCSDVCPKVDTVPSPPFAFLSPSTRLPFLVSLYGVDGYRGAVRRTLADCNREAFPSSIEALIFLFSPPPDIVGGLLGSCPC